VHPLQLGDRRRQWVGFAPPTHGHIFRTIAAQDQQPASFELAAKVAEQRDSGRVGPVKIVKDQHRRALRRNFPQHSTDLEEDRALLQRDIRGFCPLPLHQAAEIGQPRRIRRHRGGARDESDAWNQCFDQIAPRCDDSLREDRSLGCLDGVIVEKRRAAAPAIDPATTDRGRSHSTSARSR